ncbi:DUF397 domain-containing protein [Streptomyces broussonetiae]|uniref:DUF397 domain-containing protein n=1 Tax=Streptomyces broussonetiae TaxID=2686304 RepID=A0ABV5E863_9ACTN
MNGEETDFHGSTLRWFTSSYSNGAGGECVECAVTGHALAIRDSKHPDGPQLVVSVKAWNRFLVVARS